MSELVNITKAFHARLDTVNPSLETAYESVSFTPIEGVPYQRVQLVPRTPENPTLGDTYYREVGEFQIFLCYPSNKGTLDILERAELTRDAFKRGLTLVEAGTVITIMRTPSIGAPGITGTRLVVPIIVKYKVDVFD